MGKTSDSEEPGRIISLEGGLCLLPLTVDVGPYMVGPVSKTATNVRDELTLREDSAEENPTTDYIPGASPKFKAPVKAPVAALKTTWDEPEATVLPHSEALVQKYPLFSLVFVAAVSAEAECSKSVTPGGSLTRR